MVPSKAWNDKFGAKLKAKRDKAKAKKARAKVLFCVPCESQTIIAYARPPLSLSFQRIGLVSIYDNKVDPLETLMGLGFLTLVGVTEKDSTRDATSKFENPILNKLDAHVSGLLDLVSSEEDFAGKPGKSASSPAAFQDLGEAVATIAKASQSSSVAVALSSHDNESKLSSVSALELEDQPVQIEGAWETGSIIDPETTITGAT
ncbi:hypothetical protein F2Q70_00027587 [Brassica cretica]|uniref:Uncharacterized protein n=1 Tax=Brassica cretica TaxID=69181 RepID=A0A8S9LCX9_BRACR|nr:hypothetical protein F2Q70_00027587 [Brassica cretica]